MVTFSSFLSSQQTFDIVMHLPYFKHVFYLNFKTTHCHVQILPLWLIHYCDRQNNNPAKDVHGLIPKTCEYVCLHGKRDFTDTIKLKIPRWA